MLLNLIETAIFHFYCYESGHSFLKRFPKKWSPPSQRDNFFLEKWQPLSLSQRDSRKQPPTIIFFRKAKIHAGFAFLSGEQ